MTSLVSSVAALLRDEEMKPAKGLQRRESCCEGTQCYMLRVMKENKLKLLISCSKRRTADILLRIIINCEVQLLKNRRKDAFE